MRKIKFRGKRKDNGEWAYGFYTEITSYPNKSCYISTSKGLMEIIPQTVSQFTGLTDKNGKEIYEGDVIRIHEGRNDFKITSILWSDELPCYEPSNKELRHALKLRYSEHYEIIGNIHDNPELLTKE